ncbi:MAG TPA: response regulator [Puia sp.]|uniref:hybrid sensor histidine kinase/response regulator n=1 Tax=Puia sp. TaxID=2045100 RepID=UPI002CF29B89|nr:response regulator [Puia sp.]HVU98481.1 response regulator [Puia sp.]
MTNNRFIYSILAAFIAGMLLLVFIQYNSSRSIDQLIEGNRLLTRDMKIGNDLREMERDILSVESKVRAAVATGDSAFVAGVDAQTAEAQANLDSLEMIDPDAATHGDVARLTVLAGDRMKRKNVMMDSFFRVGKKPPARLIADTRHPGAANEINGIMRRLYQRRKARLDAISISVQKNARIAKTSGMVLIVLVVLTGSGVFWFIIDRIRKQNELIRRLDASERQLQDAVKIKENFLANMSHEIRTPLNSIIGFTRLLTKKSLDAESREFVSAIKDSGENLLTIINDILDLSKIEAGMMRVDARPFAVRELFHSVETLFRHRVKEKGLDLAVSVEDGVPTMLLGDATRLTQVLVNLISNSAKFTEKGGIAVRVSMRGPGDGGLSGGGHGGGGLGDGGLDRGAVEAGRVWLRVVVQDTGIGISREQQALIFERFSQAEGSTTRKYGGTGLGLAIVNELIVLQDGQIEVESEVGKGTTFTFSIPYMLTEAAPVAAAPSGSAEPRMDGMAVLVADDNRMNQRLMEHLLRGAGVTFEIVDDGRKVIDRLKEKRFQLVLMDIQMPVMDGYTASRMIREDLRSSIPIIAMTAHAMRGEREKCLESGMNDYLSKPIDAEELFRMMGKFLKNEVIDLGYLKELSGGDREYEIEMAEQFLATVPEELRQLEAALDTRDRVTLSKVAHNMKTTVSIMGLGDRLFSLLDQLEYPEGVADLPGVLGAVRRVCETAIEEVRRLL